MSESGHSKQASVANQQDEDEEEEEAGSKKQEEGKKGRYYYGYVIAGNQRPAQGINYQSPEEK